MKRMYLLAAIVGVVLPLFCSCAGDETVSSGQPRVQTITAAMADPSAPEQTRTCIDMSDTGNGYLGLLWQPADSIGVYGKAGTRNALFLSEAQGSVPQADFSGTMDADDQPYRAYYPYSTDNDGAEITALKGHLPQVQPFDGASGRLTGDYKYGAPVGQSRRFNFRHLFSMLRVTVDASGTSLAGEALDRVELTVTDGQGTPRGICGSFTFSAIDGTWGNVTDASGSVSMVWTARPQLAEGSSHQGFITVMPTVKKGDRISVSVQTEAHLATFTAVCQADFEAEAVYNIPLSLKNYAAQAETFGYKESKLPSLSQFGFSVEQNAGKLLNNKLVWNSRNQPQFNSVSTYPATISGNEVSLMIPYLYDFHLVPTFTASEGATVSVGGVKQTSGVTEVDFTQPVTYTVESDGMKRDYVVSITNTGLPVVVVQQSASGDFSPVTSGGFLGIGGTTVNKFVNFMVRDKDTEWVQDDQLTIYNADGTLDVPTALCGVRLRGNTSKAFPKKPFAIKLVEKQKVLGMPKHKRWVLLANWLDHSMIRNAVAFDLAHAFERAWKSGAIEEGIPWNVHGQPVELVIDGHHVGNYYLCEQIKIGSKRLNIQDNYEDASEKTLEKCGYLMELDNNYDETYKFITRHYSVPFMFKDDVLSDDIFAAVKAKVQGIEDNIYNGNFAAAYEDMDIYSVIDQWLIWELTMNHEFLDPRSVYYFMNGNGKLSAGPVWDFDRATFQNVENARSQGSSGDRLKPYDQWICWSASPVAGGTEKSMQKSTSCVFYPALVKDPIFQAAVQKRWAVLYPYLLSVKDDISAYGQKLERSYEVNSQMWPTSKAAIQKYKNNFSDWSGDENISAYKDVIDNFLTVYQKRLDGMNMLITSGRFAK